MKDASLKRDANLKKRKKKFVSLLLKMYVFKSQKWNRYFSGHQQYAHMDEPRLVQLARSSFRSSTTFQGFLKFLGSLLQIQVNYNTGYDRVPQVQAGLNLFSVHIISKVVEIKIIRNKLQQNSHSYCITSLVMTSLVQS